MNKITLPLCIFLPRRKTSPRKIIINLNEYRNWHYIVSNQIKEEYTKALSDQLDGLVLDPPVSLTFVLFKGSNRKSDRANVLSIQEKFFCDSLVFYGCLPDDSDQFISSTKYLTGGVDHSHPRVEVIIE